MLSVSSLYRETHAYVLAQFHSTRLTYHEVATSTGLNRRTVEKIAREEIVEPNVEMLDALAEFFRKQGERA